MANRFNSDRSDWEFQILEGFGAVAEGLAAELGPRLFLETPVTGVAEEGGGVRVSTRRGEIAARAAIIAVPPPVSAGLLAEAHWAQAALRAFEPGDLIKLSVHYARPFWRDAGLSGASLSAAMCGLATAETTALGGGRATLTVFLGGPEARALGGKDAAARWEAIAGPLRRIFGPEVDRTEARHERIWVDNPWSGGGYNAHLAPGAAMAPEAVLRSFRGGVTFASAEIAEVFPGYVEGALRAGKDAAARVLAAAP
ncbi:MAG: FAD-dependent oxidoreductase, partial [Pseudomonadota bacterium]